MTEFVQVLRSEWTKFRSVRGWMIGTAVAGILMVLLGVLSGNGSHSTVSDPQHPNGVVGHPDVPIGPGGEAVTDSFYFLHQQLNGNGSITARLTSFTGGVQSDRASSTDPGPTLTAKAVQPWAKGGLIIKASTSPGSAYAAIMVTGAHGVRMQDNYTGDIAGPAWSAVTAAPQWLRLTRTGDTITGAASRDGSTWSTVGTVRLALPGSVPAGMFATSPAQNTFEQHLGGGSGSGMGTEASATFDSVDLRGASADSGWTATTVGDPGPGPGPGPKTSGDTYTVVGSGDIAPGAANSGGGIEQTLVGTFLTLIVMAVLGVLFISTEYRRGMIRTSMTATPRRGVVLAAKAVILAAVTFVTGLAGAVITVPIGEHILRGNGNFIPPVTALTEARVVAGTAALLAVAAVFALALGTILRRSVGAVTAAIVLVALPYILGIAGALPTSAAQWLLRVSPAAAFAIQQSIPAYHQVDATYIPSRGYFPLAPWSGFVVLCAWTALALGVAGYLLRRRDV